MMSDHETELYLPNGSNQVEDMVRVSSRDEKAVKFFTEGGGFVHIAPVGEFDEKYRNVSRDELVRLTSVYRPMSVGGDWMYEEGRSPLQAWSNGSKWNGWEMPYFSKETLLSPEGGLSFRNEWNWLVHDAAKDAFVLISSNEPMPINRDTDFTAILDRAGEEEYFEMEFLGGEREITVYRGQELTLADGSKVVGYGVGAGSWCWDEYDAPTLDDEPASPSM